MRKYREDSFGAGTGVWLVYLEAKPRLEIALLTSEPELGALNAAQYCLLHTLEQREPD